MAGAARRNYLGRMAESGPLREFVDRHRRLFILTGAGCSVNSGIPDYRDADGAWRDGLLMDLLKGELTAATE